jgi:hypothetical protein
MDTPAPNSPDFSGGLGFQSGERKATAGFC